MCPHCETESNRQVLASDGIELVQFSVVKLLLIPSSTA